MTTASQPILKSNNNLVKYRDVKNYSCMFEISRLGAASNLASSCTANQPISESLSSILGTKQE